MNELEQQYIWACNIYKRLNLFSKDPIVDNHVVIFAENAKIQWMEIIKFLEYKIDANKSINKTKLKIIAQDHIEVMEHD